MYEFSTTGTCSKKIRFDIKDDNTIHNVEFTGGCNGNLKAISSLVEGLKTEEVITRLQGIDCGGRGTSCGDQFAKAIKEVTEKNK